VVLALIAGLMGGCAMSPQQLAYRDRLELGFVTPEDMERFKTPDGEQLALTSDARSLQPLYAQAQDTLLMKAATEGDIARIKSLLASGAQVNAIDEWGNSALLIAAREGQVESARMLLKAGADVDGRGGMMSPLAAAALRGHAILVRLLIRNNANVNAVSENDLSPLMNAVKLNRLGVVPALIEAGASTQVLDRAGDNVLAVAVGQNYPEMLALLLKLGVNPEMMDRNGLSALYWAEYLNRPELAQLLRDAGADPAHEKTQVIVSQPYNFGEF
jgi:ankyrin repeat protein